MIALALAVVGVYGVVANLAAQRTREIGIRLALGATRANVARLVVASGITWALAGVALGLLASAGVGRLLSRLLFETAPADRLTLTTVTAPMVVVAVVDITARRAVSGATLTPLRSD